MWKGRLVNPVGEGASGPRKASVSLITPECSFQPAAALMVEGQPVSRSVPGDIFTLLLVMD